MKIKPLNADVEENREITPIESCLFAFTVLVNPDLSVAVLPEINVESRKFSLDGPFHAPSLISMACTRVIQEIEQNSIAELVMSRMDLKAEQDLEEMMARTKAYNRSFISSTTIK